MDSFRSKVLIGLHVKQLWSLEKNKTINQFLRYGLRSYQIFKKILTYLFLSILSIKKWETSVIIKSWMQSIFPGSLTSCFMGLGVGCISGFAAYRSSQEEKNWGLSLLVSVCLTGLMGYRFISSWKVNTFFSNALQNLS